MTVFPLDSLYMSNLPGMRSLVELEGGRKNTDFRTCAEKAFDNLFISVWAVRKITLARAWLVAGAFGKNFHFYEEDTLGKPSFYYQGATRDKPHSTIYASPAYTLVFKLNEDSTSRQKIECHIIDENMPE
mmetsp:Transcript_18884/g.54440  ORF Transcript_18884/g.54440 Transcript_18884/m.54440 type:complete len:130 (+) Transcript_18884:824-1213(+)